MHEYVSHEPDSIYAQVYPQMLQAMRQELLYRPGAYESNKNIDIFEYRFVNINIITLFASVLTKLTALLSIEKIDILTKQITSI